MKSKFLKIGISTILSLLLLASVIAIAYPIIDSLTTNLISVRDQFLESFQEKTGLRITYKSVSPSFLSGFKVRGITIYDASADVPVLSIDKASLGIRLRELFSGNFDRVFSKLIVQGIYVEYDSVVNTDIVQKIQNLLPKTSEEPSQKQEQTNALPSISIPFDIAIQDVNIHYKDAYMDVLVTLNKINLTESINEYFLSIQTESQIYVQLEESLLDSLPQELQEGLKEFSVSLGIDASITSELTGSSAGIKITSVDSAAFDVARTSLLLEYRDEFVRLSTIRSVLPFSILGEYELATNIIRVRTEMDNFDPFSLIFPKQRNDLLEKIKGTTISGTYGIEFNIKTSQFDYNGNGKLFVPPTLYPQGVTLGYDFYGDLDMVHINNFTAKATDLELAFNGNFNIGTLQPFGVVQLKRYTLPSGTDISAEMYLDPLKKGFTCFIPQLFVNEKIFTAVQLDVIPDLVNKYIDFSFEVSDYSRIEYGLPGIISIAGSFLYDTQPYVQAELSIENFFIQSAIDTAALIVPEEQRLSLESLSSTLSPYITTNEIYVATDFSSVTYNAPYWILADTSNDNNLLIFSFTGNETTVNLSQFDLLFFGQNLQLTADMDFDSDYSQGFFTAEAAVNSIPYSFTGSYMAGAFVNISGSYGLEASVLFGNEDNGYVMDASVSALGVPVALQDLLFLCSFDATGSIPLRDISSFYFNFNNFSIAETSGTIPTEPSLEFKGNITNYGFAIDEMVYTDTVSTLQGSGGLMWNILGNTLESAGLNLSLFNLQDEEEFYQINFSVSNPTGKSLEEYEPLKDLYFSSQIQISHFPMARVLTAQSQENTINAVFTAMGTMENPFINAQIQPSSFSAGNVPVEFASTLRLEDGVFYVDDTQLLMGAQKITDISAFFSIVDFAGQFHARYNADISNAYKVDIPLTLTVESSLSELAKQNPHREQPDFIESLMTLTKGLPEYVSLNAKASLKGNLFEENGDISITFVRVPGVIMVTSDNDLGISGAYYDSGIVDFTLSGKMPLHASINGTVIGNAMDIYITNIQSDISKFTKLLSYPYIKAHGGLVSGELRIGGVFTDPEFNGDVVVQNPVISCPDYVPDLMKSDVMDVVIRNNRLTVHDQVFTVKKGKAILDLELVMDRWFLDYLKLWIKTPTGVTVPAKVNISSNPGSNSGLTVLVEGNSTCDLDMTITTTAFDLKGTFFTEDLEINIITDVLGLQKKQNNDVIYTNPNKDYSVTLDMELTTGQHVELIYDPLLRGLIAPNTNVKFTFDSITQDVTIISDVVLRGGEVTYLNRNFYIREGRIIFSEINSLDPLITIRAEIREQDVNGEPVRITMSAENQRLSNFNPTYTSSPPKSEIEIMTILGQAFTGDIQSGLDILLTGVDYGVQVFLLRKMENALRDFLNFDIFSLRTMGLQNTLKQLLTTNAEGGNRLTIGNFLDNTTVYIGKYFGSSIYADAMFHFAYDEDKVLSGQSDTGLVFQPEIGLAMDSPIGAIRWSIAPEVGTTNNLWVPSTSISLSWKFTF